MITLYHCRDARSFRALWALEELGLDYDLKVLPFPPRQRHEGMKDINPLGTIPVMFDGTARMTESAAIPHYLATKYGPSPLAVAVEEPGYADYLNFLVMGEATLTFPQTIHLRYAVFAPPEARRPEIARDYAEWFGSRLRNAEAMMDGDYAAAGRFTMADVSLGYAIKLALNVGLAEFVTPGMNAYFARLSAREGYVRAMEAQKVAEI
ncbi:glutathione S-transferase [Novosphingobium sp. KCTC 2891]|uniref:glutathione S-transferase family protein n=1 Tax=Novosphingobium sp. KCTC 2891 TaxID=2989730 RepID=UPI00222274C1|nr:glutathione S-transferase [Novosphingobium sp. KCTC 2891]MCW1383202.1 glutathione S-transferase [Novosphingobium sp. KCTC 2891]